jgi:hypothetical protein
MLILILMLILYKFIDFFQNTALTFFVAKMQSKLSTLPTSVTATVPAPTTHKETLSLNAQVIYLISLEFFFKRGKVRVILLLVRIKYIRLGWVGWVRLGWVGEEWVRLSKVGYVWVGWVRLGKLG